MPRKFFLATFGCRTNQADSAAIREDFLSSRYMETRQAREADVIVVNSCTVTHRSDQQVRQLARQLRRENPDARLIVTGCYAQRDPVTLARVPGIDAVVGNTRKTDLVQIASRGAVRESFLLSYRNIAAIYRDDFRKVGAIDLTPATQLGGKTRPFVKIQEGCDAKCTYCIIPVVRGPSRSVPPQLILHQVRDLVDRGFKEIVLTGIHIGTYGMHLELRYSLDRLLEEIVGVPGLGRVRVSSIEPMELSRKIIRLAAESDKIAPHFHICLQSGSDDVLRKMLRPYSAGKFAKIVEEIRDQVPDAGIGTDVIVGFPGESEEDHRKTVEFIRRMPFTYLHVFPYSDRSGTPASRMSNKVDSLTLKRRSKELRQLSEEKNTAFRRSFVGRELSVLTLTEEEGGMRTGLSGNYLRVKVDPAIPANAMVRGLVTAQTERFLVMSRISQPSPTRSFPVLPPPAHNLQHA